MNEISADKRPIRGDCAKAIILEDKQPCKQILNDNVGNMHDVEVKVQSLLINFLIFS